MNNLMRIVLKRCLARVKFSRDGEGDKKALGKRNCSINI